MKKVQEFLKDIEKYQQNLQYAKNHAIKVGLPKDKSSGKIYENGETVIEVGVKHEYGIGVPQRSFLRVPFRKKEKEIQKAFKISYEKIANEGSDTKQQLEKLGVFLQMVSREAFKNNGYGTWQELSERTLKAKSPKTKPLIDTGTLKNSITYEVIKE